MPGPPLAVALIAWLHLAAAGLAAGLLLAEYWLCRRQPDRQQVRLLGAADLGYLLALIGSLATGLARLFYYGQDPAYYLSNRLFLLKMAIFLAIGMAAIVVNRQVLGWNREARSAPVFAPLTRDLERVRGLIALQAALWLLLPLPAVLVARGFGSGT